MLALSLHAVFEGLAVGLADDEEGAWVLFAAICSHKFVMAFCIGVELGRTADSLAAWHAYGYRVTHLVGKNLSFTKYQQIQQLTIRHCGYLLPRQDSRTC